MGRVTHWESKLTDFIAKCSNIPFEWGTHDCATFARKCVELITNQKLDIPTWSSKKEALLLLSEKSLEEYVDEVLTQVDVNYVQRGDVVATNTDEGMALGIYVSPTGAFASKNGILYIPREQIVKAWRV